MYIPFSLSLAGEECGGINRCNSYFNTNTRIIILTNHKLSCNGSKSDGVCCIPYYCSLLQAQSQVIPFLKHGNQILIFGCQLFSSLVLDMLYKVLLRAVMVILLLKE